MILHTILLAPRRFAARALIEMTTLGVNDAGVAGGELLKTRKAETLIKTLTRFTAAVDAKNGAGKF